LVPRKRVQIRLEIHILHLRPLGRLSDGKNQKN
jgi:hypothetical protein